MFSSVTIAYMWHWQMVSRKFTPAYARSFPLQLKQPSVVHDLAVLGLTARHDIPAGRLK